MHERPRGKYARGEPEETRARSALRALVQHPCENFLFDTPWIAWRRLPAAQEIDGMKFFVLLVDAHGFSVLSPVRVRSLPFTSHADTPHRSGAHVRIHDPKAADNARRGKRAGARGWLVLRADIRPRRQQFHDLRRRIDRTSRIQMPRACSAEAADRAFHATARARSIFPRGSVQTGSKVAPDPRSEY